jgi:hypothetical protein
MCFWHIYERNFTYNPRAKLGISVFGPRRTDGDRNQSIVEPARRSPKHGGLKVYIVNQPEPACQERAE